MSGRMGADQPRTADERGPIDDERRSPPVPTDPTGWGWGWWPWASRHSDPDEVPAGSPASATEETGGWLQRDLPTLLVVVGAVLFVIPDPVTTVAGLLLIVLGVVAWLLD